MRAPDHHTSKLGSKDFVFQVNKWPFSITCNPLLPKTTESFIDLALVKDMKIPMKKVECRKISYGGYETKLVGSISQTIQVVYDGVASGTMHLKAKVIRHLSNLYGVDCIAGLNLYKNLIRSESVALANESYDVSDALTEKSQGETDEDASTNSADEYIFNSEDSPKTRKRKRRNRFMVANLSFTSSMKSSPPSSPGASSPSTSKVQISKPYLKSLSPGKPLPERYPPDPVQQRRDHHPPPPPNPPLQLHPDRIFCGHHAACACVDRLRPPQLRLLPPHYPIYLPIGHQPCGLHCGSHHVHGDNLHPPNPRLCPCDPPRLYPVLIQALPIHPHADHARPVLHPEPPLPPDFQPCGPVCDYQLCQCLRQYDGRDWAS